MVKKKMLSFMVGMILLSGASSASAALWDRPCQFAIEELQFIQKQIATKKQEVDQARVASTIPANFISDHLKESMGTDHGAEVMQELKALFPEAELAVSEFNKRCLASHRGAQ